MTSPQSSCASPSAMGVERTPSTLSTSASRRLGDLQAAMVAAASGEAVKRDVVLTWATEIEQLRSLLASTVQSVTSHPTSEQQRAASAQAPREKTKLTQKVPSHLHIADRGQLEERHVAPQVSTSVTTSTRYLSLCVVALLDSLMNASHADAISLVVPYRGMDDELRCLCRLTRGSDRLFGGSSVVRGTSTLEHNCLKTGMVLNMGPRAFLGEKGGDECVSFLELLQEGRDKARLVASPTARHAGSACARLCCPVRRGPSSPTLGVLTSVSSRRRFDADDENLFFDAATIVASLLNRCTDYAVLQTAFSSGGLFQMLPPHNPSAECPIVEPRHQLAYRVDTDVSRNPQSLRIVSDQTQTVKLREGTPVESVFSHMERVQNSWLSAVKLNVQLKRICDEKEEYINALLSRAKSERVPPKSTSATERVAAGGLGM